MTVEDVMFLLKRNWFMDIQDIYSLFWELPEDVYYDVYQRRHEVPELAHVFYEPVPNVSGLKLTEITEKEWNDSLVQKEEQRIRAIYRFNKQYVAPPRPREAIDENLSVLQNSLEKKKIVLEDMLRATKKTKKYVPPGQRSTEPEDPMVREQRDAIQKLENEIAFLNERVATLDQTWSELKCVDALLASAGRLYAS